MNYKHIASEADFATDKREKLLDFRTYAAEADDLIARIPKAGIRLADPDWRKDKDSATLMRMTGARAEYALNLLTLQYSAGLAIEDLRALYLETLHYFEVYAEYSLQFNQEQGASYIAPHITLGDAEFSNANRLVCFGILLGCTSMLGRIASIIDYGCSVPDGMLERLLGIYLDGRHSPTDCTRHLPYYKTLKIFDTHGNDRPDMMREYLSDWYVASRREPYYESHKRGADFTGYWSWEAGAITVALEIDDALYHDAPFYPVDMVAFGRMAKLAYSPVGLPAIQPNELRAKADDPCPAAGLWRSIDVLEREQRFAQGEPMANLQSAYGLTVWRFIES